MRLRLANFWKALAMAGALFVGLVPIQALPSAALAQSAGTAAAAPYYLGPGDHLRISVYNEPGLSGEFAVSDSGGVSLPLVGEIKAAGLSVVQFQALATKTLADGYLNDPKLSVEVIAYRPFYILGEVNKPGEYPYTVGLTVLKAVATANGFTYRSNTKSIFVKHEGEPQEHEVHLDGGTLVQPGDTIRIRERFF